ncbi:unnamed protein product [Owenia fusiformis]|uniref:Uncharacterized protein n=1 Tax=Owenia fusiformis TaxID=6347 RepID=A0A8J1XGM0_OWEFU|nr:unnamed protein product [Owenia fusiformis]
MFLVQNQFYVNSTNHGDSELHLGAELGNRIVIVASTLFVLSLVANLVSMLVIKCEIGTTRCQNLLYLNVCITLILTSVSYYSNIIVTIYSNSNIEQMAKNESGQLTKEALDRLILIASTTKIACHSCFALFGCATALVLVGFSILQFMVLADQNRRPGNRRSKRRVDERSVRVHDNVVYLRRRKSSVAFFRLRANVQGYLVLAWITSYMLGIPNLCHLHVYDVNIYVDWCMTWDYVWFIFTLVLSLVTLLLYVVSYLRYYRCCSTPRYVNKNDGFQRLKTLVFMFLTFDVTLVPYMVMRYNVNSIISTNLLTQGVPMDISLYTPLVGTLLLPIIYSLRTKDIKIGFGKCYKKLSIYNPSTNGVPSSVPENSSSSNLNLAIPGCENHDNEDSSTSNKEAVTVLL